MSRRIIYENKKVPRAQSILFRFFILPFTLIALLVVSIGIYTFSNANTIMRLDPKPLDDFANNILPVYSIASFQTLDGVTTLNGWYFPSKTTAVSTVVMVHGQGANRLEFDVDTASLYDYFVNNGFNVLSFDLRHSGDSGGNLSTFGYAEWSDVVAAISYVKKISTTTDVILFGFDSGISACVLAMEKLPVTGMNGKSSSDSGFDVDFDRSYIRGLILDSPSLSTDDYVQEVCRTSVLWGEWIGQYTIPYAVRLSAEAQGATNLAAVVSRTQLPIHLIYKKTGNAAIDEKTEGFIKERNRLLPSLTTTYAIAEATALPTYTYDMEAYLDSIDDYLNRFIK
jgi:pimeloyl-ACP methyl ester carboxylesterase